MEVLKFSGHLSNLAFFLKKKVCDSFYDSKNTFSHPEKVSPLIREVQGCFNN